jgi:hypothetical protein
MKYGEIKWKVEKVVFKIAGGNVTWKCEVDQGRTYVKKTSVPNECLLDIGAPASKTT